jgi:hypothetical protein
MTRPSPYPGVVVIQDVFCLDPNRSDGNRSALGPTEIVSTRRSEFGRRRQASHSSWPPCSPTVFRTSKPDIGSFVATRTKDEDMS